MMGRWCYWGVVTLEPLSEVWDSAWDYELTVPCPRWALTCLRVGAYLQDSQKR